MPRGKKQFLPTDIGKKLHCVYKRVLATEVRHARERAESIFATMLDKVTGLVETKPKRKYRRRQTAIAAPKRTDVRRSRKKKVGRPRLADKK